jgi:anti-sigma B factor antagonist
MELKTVSAESELSVIALVGEMDLYTADQLKRYVTEHFAAQSSPLIIDMKDLDYIDSSGIAALLHAFSTAKKHGQDICFANVHGSVRKVIDLTSLTNFFPMAATVDEAKRRVGVRT